MAIIPMDGPPPGPRQGRPGWIEKGWDEATGKWDPQNSHVGKMLAALSAGTSQRNAATYGGISTATFQNWIARGREHDPDGEFVRTEVDRGALPYIDFVRAVDLARARVEVELVAVVRQGAREDPRLALQVLARLFPHWRETTALELGMIDDPADGLGDALMKDPAVAAAAAAYAEALNATGAFADDEAPGGDGDGGQ